MFDIQFDQDKGEYRFSGQSGNFQYWRMGPYASHKECLAEALAVLGDDLTNVKGDE